MKSLIILLLLFCVKAFAAAPTIDSFHIQSFMKLSNNTPVSATSGDFVFAVFKGANCIWAKRYLAVSINTGVMNQKISGNGTNITSINNSNATPGECVNNFAGTTLNSTLLNSGAADTLSIRAYAESTIDTYKPIWDVQMTSAPTAFVADYANTAATAYSANDLASSMKVSTSSGAADMGKVPVLNGSGVIHNSMINASGLTIANTQITGLGTAATANTGSSSGNVPLLGAGGRLPSTMMPTYTANRILASDGTGVMSGSYSTTVSSAGAGDSGKIAVLNGSGKFDNTTIDSTSLTPNPANLSAAVAVNKGGTGLNSITSGSLMVGAGTGNVTTLAPGTAGNILTNSAGTWTSVAPDSANIVDKTNAQTVGGNKTWSNNQTINGTLTVGSGGSAIRKILYCTIPSAAITGGIEQNNTCTGATTTSVVFCSSDTVPASKWSFTARVDATDSIAIMPVRASGTATWTSGFNCVVYVN